MKSAGYRPGQDVPPPGAGYRGGGQEGFDFEEIFAGGGAGGGFSDFFEQMFGRGRGRGGPSQGARPSGDTRAKLSVPLEAVYKGDSIRISVGEKALDIKIPKGIRQGQVIRLPGQGRNGGNLLLEVEYAAHPDFEVDGRNILYIVPIMPWQAALGGNISVATLGGHVDLKIPPGSEAGKKLRLRGRGLPGATPGDQIVELEIVAPVPVTDAQRDAYASLQSAFSS